MSSQRRCPRCNGQSVRFSHRRGFLELTLFRLLCLRPYRCANCDKRFFRFGESGAHRTPCQHLNKKYLPYLLMRDGGRPLEDSSRPVLFVQRPGLTAFSPAARFSSPKVHLRCIDRKTHLQQSG